MVVRGQKGEGGTLLRLNPQSEKNTQLGRDQRVIGSNPIAVAELPKQKGVQADPHGLYDGFIHRPCRSGAFEGR